MCDTNEKEPVQKNVIIVKVIIVCFAVNFLSQVIFLFPLFLGKVKLMYANKVETKEK